jgi:dsDNA-specific endonuclease/ATPase MutS2
MKFTDLLSRLFSARASDARRPALREPVDAAGEEEEGGVDPFNPFPEPVVLEIRDVLDLHAIHPRDVRAVVVEYLYQARVAGFRSVRIIHGRGIGVQREIVRAVLGRTSFVEHYTDAPAEAGGWGATIARLAPEDNL